ncbi:hypothetical protein [Pseudomonas arsenicoxydans]|uniref:hypothetical protein n=1 Tax=Pseudomonas arsenicoxydans TaxID=702115 RepID=UPI001ABF5C2A|nr:hypothetical protein [Pseudomonas arsenicoxydans]
MSDYQDFCESFGGCASDPDFMDKWMEEYLVDEVKETKTTLGDILPNGKIVHIIKLSATYPARPMGVIWNKELSESLPCAGSNYLKNTEHDEPASWFVRKGFTVRSIKTKGFWYQVAFKDTNPETRLEERERKDYESICSTLNPDWVKNCKYKN